MTLRRYDFEGSFNFRDLGGWRTAGGSTVRWGRMFRADSVHLMSEADVLRCHGELGVRTVLDLRSDVEIAVGGAGALAGRVDARHHLPLSSRRAAAVDGGVVAAASDDRSPDAMAAQYAGMLDASRDLLVSAVDALLASDALPAVFFCAAGKDRTGVLSAVVLGTLGVRDEDIVEDYVLTAGSIDRIIRRFAATEGAPAMYSRLPSAHFAPHAETMHRVIAYVRQRYGSFQDYLVGGGLDAAGVDRLKASMLEGV